MPTLTDDGQVRRSTLYPEASCPALIDRLWKTRPHWRQRGPAFFTLGAATYMDVCKGSFPLYDSIRGEANLVLADAFGDLLDDVKQELQTLLDAPCVYNATNLALPGFHIFLGESLRALYRDNLHLDLQHTYLPLRGSLFTPTLTFTLPLAVPKGGAGIEFCRRPGPDPYGVLDLEMYVPGQLLAHSGRALHRRAHLPATEQCSRVTLQGHGIFLEQQWLLYW
jgi:hypothetical protein